MSEVTHQLVELNVKGNNYLVPENFLLAQIADDESYFQTVNTTKYSKRQKDRGKKDKIIPQYKIYLLKEHFTKSGKRKKVPLDKLPWARPKFNGSGLRGESQLTPTYPPGSFIYVRPLGIEDVYQIEHISVNTLSEYLAADGENTDLNNEAQSRLGTIGFLDGLFRPSTKYRVPETAIAPGGEKIESCSEVIDNFPYSDSDEKQNELDEDLDFETWCSKKGGTSSLSGTSKAISNIQKKVAEFQKSLKEGGDNPLRQLYDDVTESQEDYEQKIKDLKEGIKPFIDEITEAIAGLFLKLKTKVIRKSNLFFNLFKSKSPSAGRKNVSAWQDVLQKAITCIFKLLISNLFNMVMKAIMSFINKIVNTVNCVVENFISQFMGQLIGQLSALLNSIFGPIGNLLG